MLGTTGLAAGATIGAAVGLVPALFTFGLSIPVGAAIGGSIGASTGGTVGFGAGGALGYGMFTKREEITDAASSAKDFVKKKTQAVTSAVGNSVNTVKTKIRGSTGSTV